MPLRSQLVYLPLFSLVSILFVSLSLCGCVSPLQRIKAHNKASREFDEKLLQAIAAQTVAVSTFKCEDAFIAEAVRTVFVLKFTERGIQVVDEAHAKVVVSGIITINFDGASSSDGVALGGSWGVSAGQSGRSSYGKYVTGVTALATENGKIVASSMVSQTRDAKGVKHAPEEMAAEAAVRIVASLRRQLEKTVLTECERRP